MLVGGSLLTYMIDLSLKEAVITCAGFHTLITQLLSYLEHIDGEDEVCGALVHFQLTFRIVLQRQELLEEIRECLLE